MQITFNLFSEVLLPSQKQIRLHFDCVSHHISTSVGGRRSKNWCRKCQTCTFFNQDLSSSLNNGTHKICIMSANIIHNTFIRVVFDDAKNCRFQSIADSFILVSATVLELLDSLSRDCGSQFSKNSLYGQIKYFLFSSKLPVVTIDSEYLNQYST